MENIIQIDQVNNYLSIALSIIMELHKFTKPNY
jgi:hypothetical protein